MKPTYYSNIYWHFTGSPSGIDWGKIRRPKDILKHGKPKDIEDSIAILKKILKNKTLKATATEEIFSEHLTEEFCCVTDIPLNSLVNHKKFYGNVAIGFNCNKIHKFFNPVLYLPQKFLLKSAGSIKITTPENEFVEMPAYTLDREKINRYFFNHIKITMFSEKADDSFYQEREWRKIGDFKFEEKDIEAIIAPKECTQEIIKFLKDYKFYNPSIISWDLIDKG